MREKGDEPRLSDTTASCPSQHTDHTAGASFTGKWRGVGMAHGGS